VIRYDIKSSIGAAHELRACLGGAVTANLRFEPTVASVPLAIPFSPCSSAEAQARR